MRENMCAEDSYNVISYHLLLAAKINSAVMYESRTVFPVTLPTKYRGSASLDYDVWGVLNQATNKTFHPNINTVKLTIKKECAKISKYFIVNSCADFLSSCCVCN